MIASVADIVVNPNVISKFLVNGLSTFFIKGMVTSSNGAKSLPKYQPNYIILDN